MNNVSFSVGRHDRFSVGLTGGIGCGKTTVANQFAALGAAVIDTDKIAHNLTAPGGAGILPICAQFGEAFLDSDGALNRGKMRELVFTDQEAKKKLEAILHPLIRINTEEAAQTAEGKYVLFVVPLLIESGTWQQRVSRVLVVDCPEALQIQRVMQRSGLTEFEVRAIMASQVPRETRLKNADDVIINDTNFSALLPQIERLHALYCNLATRYDTNLTQNL